jgi:hypothetical protein
MKLVKLLLAMIVASIFVVPALSMQDHGRDCCCDQNACKVCHKLMAIEKAGCHGPEMGPATDNAREQFCKLCMKSMMPHDICFCEKPMMPHDGCGCEKSMMGCDGKEKQDCGCEKSMMGCDGKEKQDCGCGKSMMGCDGKEKQDCGCGKSMMGCDGKDKEYSGSGIKIYFEGQDNQMPMVGDDLN